MSLRLFGEDVLFLQRFLTSAGFYRDTLDGKYGDHTDEALTAFEKVTEAIADELGRFDNRSERNIGSLQPKAQRAARVFLKTVLAAGIEARIISGTRTYTEQDALFRKGRFGNPGPKVTNARGGKSNHNFGIAWDIGIFKGGKYLDESPLYKKAADVGLTADLEWGGNWKTFPDRPHYQLATGLKLAMVREKFEEGQVIV
jgi:peptidoglycan LD-endopeptidase CwlK